jgi:hypothetical protein
LALRLLCVWTWSSSSVSSVSAWWPMITGRGVAATALDTSRAAWRPPVPTV